jgi:hypothetical protein
MYELRLKWPWESPKGKRVILTIIWNFRKWHCSRNPVRKYVPETFPNPAVSGVDE